jgi:hypothetical protein
MSKGVILALAPDAKITPFPEFVGFTAPLLIDPVEVSGFQRLFEDI